ncbi:porin family protein [Corallibacter vietnamensis]|uniref:porin family protein n=1 Tax=Corallibacter vietnamensis TaxID=904130 RepID=UPI0031E3495C
MKYSFLVFIFSLVYTHSFSQETLNDKAVSDSLKTTYASYKEDQFYAGVTYNILVNKPANLSQSGFSIGVLLGFIKDMPINKRRNVAIGLGLGLASNSFNNNMFINKDALGNYNYSILSDSDISYSKNKLTMYKVELPIEFRWRTSTANEYKFWRIYTGIKLGYVLADTYKFKGDIGAIKHTNLSDMNDFQYGLTLSAGYNTWNLHFYYGLNTIFSDDAMINNKNLDVSAIKLGLIFYIL